MRPELEQMEKVSLYLLGRFSVSESEIFENRISNDPILKVEVDLHRNIIEVMAEEGFRLDIQTLRRKIVLKKRVLK